MGEKEKVMMIPGSLARATELSVLPLRQESLGDKRVLGSRLVVQFWIC